MGVESVTFGESGFHMCIWTYHVSHGCMYQMMYQLTYQTRQVTYQIDISVCIDESSEMHIAPYHVSLGCGVSNSYRTLSVYDVYRTPYRVRIRSVIHCVRI